MNSTIVTIGDEILIGQINDTNSTFISQRLSSVGFVVKQKTSIGDSRDEILTTLDSALKSTDVVIVTGGLGPTKDDITKSTLAELFGCGMRNDETEARHVESLLAARGVAYNVLNQGQSLLPECCQTLHNAHGTAPGMWFEREGHILVSLPGVPFEMKALLDDVVLPRLKEHFSTKESVHRTLITTGIVESILAEQIEPWESALPEWLKLAYLPSAGRVRLRLSAYDVDSAEESRREIDRQFTELERLLPNNILGYEGAAMEQVIHNRLIEMRAKLAVAESCTGGALAEKFTAMAGASEYFMGGVVSYSNDAKSDVLGVSASDIELYGAVSESVARQMAEGARRVLKADYAISTTGIAGPTGGSAEKPVGTVWFGVATPEGSFAVLISCGTERSQIIQRAVAEGLTLLRKELK